MTVFTFFFFERDGNNIMKETDCIQIHILSYQKKKKKGLYVKLQNMIWNLMDTKIRLFITTQVAIVSKLQSALFEA